MKQHLALVISLLAIAATASCELFDPPTAEIGMHVQRDGKDISCLVQAFNDQGRQIQEKHTNELGVVYMKRLVAGTWTFKFKGHEGSMYQAVRTVSLVPGATAYIQVDVDVKSDPEAEAAASAAVVTYGEEDMSP